MGEDLVVNVVAGLIVAAMGAVLGRFSRRLGLILSGLFLPDLPQVKGKYYARYQETDKDGEIVETDEIIDANQVGRYVWGTIVSKRWDTEYTFEGRITRDVLTGQYRPVRRKNPAGIGTFQLRARQGDELLVGAHTYVDYVTGEIEHGSYSWSQENPG